MSRPLVISAALVLLTGSLLAQDSSVAGARDCQPEPGQQVTQPVRRNVAVLPVYPAGLLEEGVVTGVRVRFVVCNDGAVDSATVTFIKSIDPRFDEAAVRSVRATTYHPATRNGVPVAQIVESMVRFVPPVRRMIGTTTVISDSMPDARIVLDSTLQYLGTQRVPLGGGTMAEQYFWVDAVEGTVRRFYWLQFEGKPPGSQPYDYGRDSLVMHGAIPMRVATRAYPPSGLSDPPGSDGEKARARVEAEGFTFGPDLARVRLVWLLGTPPLDEVMVIYVEDLAPHGESVAALDRDPERWQRFRDGLIARAMAGIRIEPR